MHARLLLPAKWHSSPHSREAGWHLESGRRADPAPSGTVVRRGFPQPFPVPGPPMPRISAKSHTGATDTLWPGGMSVSSAPPCSDDTIEGLYVLFPLTAALARAIKVS